MLTAEDNERLSKLKGVIYARLDHFRQIPVEDWKRELLFCVFTPQSKALHADRCVDKLTSGGLFDGRLNADQVAEVLRSSEHYIRFHNTKADRALELVAKMPKILAFLTQRNPPFEEREFLIREVNGFGLKEASHALRNIGRRGLAILDRHILKHLAGYGVIAAPPKTLSTSKYFETENRFLDFARSAGIPIDVLDLFFWAKETGVVFK